MTDPSQLRVAAADREQVVEELREHALAGRLSSEEMGERVGSAYRGDDARRPRCAESRPHTPFWPGWVIGLALLPVTRDSWALLGPGSDLEVVHARLQARHERRLARGSRHRHRPRGLPW